MTARQGNTTSKPQTSLGLAGYLVTFLFIVTYCVFVYTLIFGRGLGPDMTERKQAGMAILRTVARNIRRDIAWAHTITINGKCDRLELGGPDGERRVWQYERGSLLLNGPSEKDLSKTIPVALCRFRLVKFWLPKGSSMVKFMLSGVAHFGGPVNLSKSDLKQSVTIAAEARHNPKWMARNHPGLR